MPTALHFTLRRSGPDQVDRGRVQSVVERYSGVARLSGTSLVLEWNGERRQSDVFGGSVTNTVEALPAERREIPARQVVEAVLQRRLWRPCIRLRVSDVRCLAGMPGATGAECRLRIAREDRGAAAEFLADLRLLVADAELDALENGHD
jgi:hypothetical protein